MPEGILSKQAQGLRDRRPMSCGIPLPCCEEEGFGGWPLNWSSRLEDELQRELNLAFG